MPNPAKARRAPLHQVGAKNPRIAPPLPVRGPWREFSALATELGWNLYPWQQTAARYLVATNARGTLLYPEVAIIVGRQNGKTMLLLPLIVSRLKQGRKVMHAAQNRGLPRDFFEEHLAPAMDEHYKHLLRPRRGISFGAGMEKITLNNGGVYRIVAPSKSGARGPANDLLVVDELREMDDTEFIAAARPTLSSSSDGQAVYLSNAGHANSVVLNGLRDSHGVDPSLAYLEWSADPEKDIADRSGWLQANPAIGHMPAKMDNLEREFKSYTVQAQTPIFETEHLCRWVSSMRIALVDPATWQQARAPELGKPLRPVLGISMDPSGTRASAVLAWQLTDGHVGVRVLADAWGEPVNIEQLGKQWKQLALRAGAHEVVFDPWTDADLARYFRNARAVNSREYATASENFARVALQGRLRWDDAEAVGRDLGFTTRKPHETGTWMAVKAKDDTPITAALAAVRAVWVASGPRPGPPRVF